MDTPAPANEWDILVNKIGLLALTMGTLEAAVMAMRCKVTNKKDHELEKADRLNRTQRDALKNFLSSADWGDEQKKDFEERLDTIWKLDDRRNKLIHLSACIVSDDSFRNLPKGCVIDARSLYIEERSGPGFCSGGIFPKRIDFAEIDKLTQEIHEARLGLVPYMDLIDEFARNRSRSGGQEPNIIPAGTRAARS